MTTDHLVPADIAELYELHEWRNAVGVLQTACPGEWTEIQATLRSFRLHRSEVLKAGGARSTIVERLERPLKDAGWVEKHFATAIVVDGVQRDSPTHSVDCFKGRVALEVEWNNKDPFYDRDLINFQALHREGAIAVGVIVTRGPYLQALISPTIRSRDGGFKYGQSTTHWTKLLPKVNLGGGGECPLLLVGIEPERIQGIDLAREVKVRLEEAAHFKETWREQHARWADAKPVYDAMWREAVDLMPPVTEERDTPE